MGRKAKPWFRKHDGWWYVTIDHKQVKLAKGRRAKKDAEDVFHRLMVDKPIVGNADHELCASVCEAYLEHTRLTKAQSTFATYRENLNLLTAHCGRVRCSKLIPNHATQVVDEKLAKNDWNTNTSSTFIKVVKACFNWAVSQGLLSRNPFASLKRGKRSGQACHSVARGLLADDAGNGRPGIP